MGGSGGAPSQHQGGLQSVWPMAALLRIRPALKAILPGSSQCGVWCHEQSAKAQAVNCISIKAAGRHPAGPLPPQTPRQSRLGRPSRGARSGAQRRGHQTGGGRG